MISKIEEINPTFEKFQFNWNDSYSWGKKVLERHKENVIAYKITDAYCYILLKSKVKFFGFRFYPKDNSVKRIDEGIFLDSGFVICNIEDFGLFRKQRILGNL